MITLAERVSAFINAEGHITETDSSDDKVTYVGFRSRGLFFSASVAASDELYLGISCAMKFDSDVEFDAPLLRALLECQDRFKCVKFSLRADDALFMCSIEQFFNEPDGYQGTFWRSVGVVEAALYDGMAEIRTKHSAKAAAEKFIEELSQGGAR